jgi:hypothetical protein
MWWSGSYMQCDDLILFFFAKLMIRQCHTCWIVVACTKTCINILRSYMLLKHKHMDLMNWNILRSYMKSYIKLKLCIRFRLHSQVAFFLNVKWWLISFVSSYYILSLEQVDQKLKLEQVHTTFLQNSNQAILSRNIPPASRKTFSEI